MRSLYFLLFLLRFQISKLMIRFQLIILLPFKMRMIERIGFHFSFPMLDSCFYPQNVCLKRYDTGKKIGWLMFSHLLNQLKKLMMLLPPLKMESELFSTDRRKTVFFWNRNKKYKDHKSQPPPLSLICQLTDTYKCFSSVFSPFLCW